MVNWNTRGLVCCQAPPRRVTKHIAKVFSIKETLIGKINLKLVILFTGYTITLLFSFFYYKKAVTERVFSFAYF